MNRSLIVLYVGVVCIVGYAFFKFSSINKVNQMDSQVINRIETSSATKKKVDEIFGQVDWDYKSYRNVRRSPSSSDSEELVAQRARFKQLRIELAALGEEAYPAILKYVVSIDKPQAYFASDFVRDLNDAAVEPIMVLIGTNSLSKKEERTFERIISSAVSSDYEVLVKFLSSPNLKERAVAAKILAERARDVMGRSYRYSYRLRDYSRRRQKKHILPLADRAKLLDLYKSEQVEKIKADLASVIGAYGEDNEDIKPELISLFEKENSEVIKASLAEALGYLASMETVSGAKDTLKPLTDALLESKSNNLRHAIISTLKSCRKKLNDDSVKALERLTADNVESVSLAALETLTLTSQYRTDCVPFVKQSLNSINRDTVRNGLRAVSQMNAGLDEVLPKVFELAKTDSYASSACGAISQIGPKIGAQAVPVLREILRSDSRSKGSAISALERMGSARAKALPELKKISAGNDRSLKPRADRLIKKIEGSVH